MDKYVPNKEQIEMYVHELEELHKQIIVEQQFETARKAGYVQGVCECVAVVGSEQNMGKKLLSEMQVTKDLANKFANPETYKTLEKGIFDQKREQKLEQTHSRKL